MDIEGRFGIELPEAELSRVRTLGELYQLVARLVYGVVPSGQPPANEPIWARLVALLVEDYGVEPGRIAWGASIRHDLGLN